MAWLIFILLAGFFGMMHDVNGDGKLDDFEMWLAYKNFHDK